MPSQEVFTYSKGTLIMELEEGRKLIAEKIMGWHLAAPHSTGKPAWYDKNGLYAESTLEWEPDISLNQCHEIEEKLTKEQWAQYVFELEHITKTESFSVYRKRLLHATALQKYSAFLKLLEGK